ncbi:MAG: zinc-ribbon domain-containing protein [Synergistaceae bacterium]
MPPRLTDKNRLSFRFPFLCSEWSSKNDIMPSELSYSSKRKIIWECEYGHSWTATPSDRTSHSSNCPYCSGRKASKYNCFSEKFPHLVKEISPKNNIDPSDITSKSGKRLIWICKNGHEWEAVVRHRANGSGCPYCSGRKTTKDKSLLCLNPYLCKEWDYAKNDLNPDEVSPCSHKKVWWECDKGHKWKAIIKSRTYGRNCPYCKKINLRQGYSCDSMLEAYILLQYLEQKIDFVHDGIYNPSFGNYRFDFLLTNAEEYVEVTSFDEKNNFSEKQYNKYINIINKKRDFVNNILHKKFTFVQRQISKKEVELIRENRV